MRDRELGRRKFLRNMSVLGLGSVAACQTALTASGWRFVRRRASSGQGHVPFQAPSVHRHALRVRRASTTNVTDGRR